jgi:hypothetical protein
LVVVVCAHAASPIVCGHHVVIESRSFRTPRRYVWIGGSSEAASALCVGEDGLRIPRLSTGIPAATAGQRRIRLSVVVMVMSQSCSSDRACGASHERFVSTPSVVVGLGKGRMGRQRLSHAIVRGSSAFTESRRWTVGECSSTVLGRSHQISRIRAMMTCCVRGSSYSLAKSSADWFSGDAVLSRAMCKLPLIMLVVMMFRGGSSYCCTS